MSVYRTDILFEKVAHYEGAMADLDSMMSFAGQDASETAEYKELAAERDKYQAELNSLLDGPDEFILQREWLERQNPC
jgi:cell division protein FtsB